MPDFSLLSLNDLIIPEVPEMPEIIQNSTNTISECETIKDLFLYSNSNITFEELQQKLIEFYLQDATNDLISRHLDAIYDDLHESVIDYIHHGFRYSDIDEFNLKALIKFISIGNEYLKDIYHRFINV
jgi:spore germination protein YaaH